MLRNLGLINKSLMLTLKPQEDEAGKNENLY